MVRVRRNRAKVGVVGCGLIAQVMHLHHLRILEDQFEISALCDLSADLVEAVGRDYGVASLHTSLETLLEEELDAVMILTSGSHAPPAIAAAQAGYHVFVEKPLCLDPEEGPRILETVEKSGVTLMVGYHKRYDPAYERALEELPTMKTPTLVRTATLEGPIGPTTEIYPIRRFPLPEAERSRLEEAEAGLLANALPDASEAIRDVYRHFLLDSMVHELNALRGMFGGPLELVQASIGANRNNVIALLRLPGAVECVCTWTNLPGLDRYEQQVDVFTEDKRLSLTFPSPFLRNAPTILQIEAGDERGATWSQQTIASWDEAFLRELRHFHACITEGIVPRTKASDALEDVKLVQAIAAVASVATS